MVWYAFRNHRQEVLQAFIPATTKKRRSSDALFAKKKNEEEEEDDEDAREQNGYILFSLGQ